MTSVPREEFFDNAAGQKVFLRSWKPAGTPKAVVTICHGIYSHSGYYLWAGEQLAAAGYSVYALDLPGRGKSEGKRFFITTIATYVEAVARMIEIAKSREPGLEVFQLGHSAGGVTSTTYALDNQDKIAGLICESFAYRVFAPDFALPILKWLGRTFPNVPALKLPLPAFTRDPGRLKEMREDPLIAGEVQPAATIGAFVSTSERLHREFSTISLPVFILHGTADKPTVPAGSEEFFAAASSKDKTLKLYDGHVHDLLNDTGREAVLADIVAWLDQRATGK